MKTTLIALLISITSFAAAQVYPGIVAGYQSVSLNDKQQHTPQRGNGFRIGGFMDVPFNKTVGVRLETAYSFMKADDNRHHTTTLHYLSLPLSFFYMPHPQLQLHAGLQLNGLLNSNSTTTSVPFDRMDYGIHGAVEFQFAIQWVAAIRYYHGMKYNTRYQEQTGAGGVTHQSHRISAIQLCLNYYLKKTKSKSQTGS